MNKKRGSILIWTLAVILVVGISPAVARELLLFDQPLTLLGYATQGAGFSLSHEHYDTEPGLQTALTNLFVEADYKFLPQMKFYTSERLTVDWAYQINSDRDSWNDRLFDKSKGHLNVDSNYWQILNEAHVTWTPGNFFFRLGKQIVSWGEMDGFRVMTMMEAAKAGDLFITVTGDISAIRKEHFHVMKDQAIVCNSGHFNVEIDIQELTKLSKKVNQIKNDVQEFVLKDGRRIYLLAEGRLVNLASAFGHPPEVMDMSFANQALCSEYMWKEGKSLGKKVYSVPAEIDRRVAALKLQALGIAIDKLTREQKRYLGSWEMGT